LADRTGNALSFKKRERPANSSKADRSPGSSSAQVALAWLILRPGITAPIASATTRAQFDELAGAVSLKEAHYEKNKPMYRMPRVARSLANQPTA
jgi:aryl-alcohol dehydrogenase-like predicted oxidoreductase